MQTSALRKTFSQTLFKTNHPRLGLLVLAIVLGALALMIASSPVRLCSDEVFHLKATHLIDQLGLKAGLNSPENPSSPGPLFSAIQLLAAPLTHLQPPAVRYINWFCLVVVISITAFQLHRNQAASPLFAAGLLLAVPLLWTPAGLALTELPALVAFALFLLLFQQGLEKPETSLRYGLLLGSAAGVALGVAILGRQTYLVVLPCLALVAFLHRRHWVLILSCIVTCLLACGWLFWIWHGLIPPGQVNVDTGLRYDHAVMGITYMGMAALFISPRFLRPTSRMEAVLGFGMACLLVVLVFVKTEPPARTLLISIFGEAGSKWAGLVIRALMGWIGTQWLIATVKTGWATRTVPWRLFLVLILIVFACSPAKISIQFSSRYVVGGLGALCLLCAQREQATIFSIARLLLGASIGAAILRTYYH